VESVRVADTVGILTPSRTAAMLGELCRATRMRVGVHAHNDLGLAVANSLAAAKAGATFIDTTLFGVGERAGNCDLRVFLRSAERIFDIRPLSADAETLEKKTRFIVERMR
jgi:homocitrate synthase NifV